MSFDLLYNPVTFLVQLCVNYMTAHGVFPISANNVEATFLYLLTVKAGGA